MNVLAFQGLVRSVPLDIPQTHNEIRSFEAHFLLQA
jgi:hypothetical protein